MSAPQSMPNWLLVKNDYVVIEPTGWARKMQRRSREANFWRVAAVTMTAFFRLSVDRRSSQPVRDQRRSNRSADRSRFAHL